MIDKLNTIRDLLVVLTVSFIIWIGLASIDGFELLITYLEDHEEYELDEILLLLVILCPFLILYSLLRIKEAMKLNKQLKKLNETLEKRVQLELQKREESEVLMLQQSRLAALGEMISNIAHQWRQPLNAISLVTQNIYYAYKSDSLNDEQMERSINKINLLSSSMSQTIDDFRNFFKPEKIKKSFMLKDTIRKALRIVDASFENSLINIDSSEINLESKVYGYENELSQVIINILNNAKDVLVEKGIEKPKIVIKLVEKDEEVELLIQDNAGGVEEKILEKIFDPYFSTKESGTGIGLYMSKIIVESNMDGILSVKNNDSGAVFTIKIPLFKEK